MLTPEKSPTKFKQLDFHRTNKINKIVYGLTQNRKYKIHQIIQDELDKIKYNLQRQIENNQIQKQLQTKNLEERDALKLRIQQKITKAQKKRFQNVQKISKTEKVKVEHVIETNKKKNEMQAQKLRQQTNLQDQMTKDLHKQFIKRQKNLRRYYRSVEQLKTQYLDAVKKKNVIYDKSLKFADLSKQQCKKRLQKGFSNSKSNIKKKMTTFIPHNIQLKQNYQRANQILQNKHQTFTDKIVYSFKVSDKVLQKNQKIYQQKTQHKKFAEKQKIQKVAQNKLSLHSTFHSKIKSCICLTRLNSYNYDQDNNNDEESSPIKTLKKNSIIPFYKTFRSNSSISQSKYKPLVQAHKSLIQKQQRQKQDRIVHKHNQMRKLLQSKKLVFRRSSSIQSAVLFNKENEQLAQKLL